MSISLDREVIRQRDECIDKSERMKYCLRKMDQQECAVLAKPDNFCHWHKGWHLSQSKHIE